MKGVKENSYYIIGMGNIGKILVQRLLQVGVNKDHIKVTDIDSTRVENISSGFGVKALAIESAGVGEMDVIIVAAGPKAVPDILKTIDGSLKAGQVVISMAAAVPLSLMRKLVSKPVSIVRILPNPPSLVGKGMNPVSFEPFEKAGVKEMVKDFLAVLGDTIEVDDEMMTWSVGLTGAALRTIFPVMDGMIRAGVEAGLSPEDSRRVAAQIFNGVSALALETELSLEQIHNMTPMQTLDETAVSELFLETARITRQKVEATQASIIDQ
ncbi:MAG: NAD(P)-binding domain-containing protein [Chloroflexi bacterium]|nr:NAD(P)-binding domain-containing protein [Chloroflexota bacterium]BCY17219.1 pyrroline-5-carboxylate reductase [Leptolinea sp. HRD-7]